MLENLDVHDVGRKPAPAGARILPRPASKPVVGLRIVTAFSLRRRHDAGTIGASAIARR